MLTVIIGENQADLSFYLISSGDVLLVGVEGIRQLSLIISIPEQKCYLASQESLKKINTVTKESCPSQSTEKSLPENLAVLLTPAKRYNIYSTNQHTTIRLEILGKISNALLYQQIAIIDCTCFIDHGVLCGECTLARYFKSSATKLINGRLFVHTTYIPLILEDLVPNRQYLTGICNLQLKSLKTSVKNVNFIEQTEPSAITWNGTDIDFEPGGFAAPPLFCENGNPSTEEVRNVDLDQESVCDVCKSKGHEYFCDVIDPECRNIVRFRERVTKADILNPKCKILHGELDLRYLLSYNLVIPFFTTLSTTKYRGWIQKHFPHIDQYLSEKIDFKHCELKTWQTKSAWKFLISGTSPATLELKDVFEKIVKILESHKLKILYICNFQVLSMSQSALIRYFYERDCQILLDHTSTKEVNKVGFSKNVAADDKQKSPREEINIMTENPVYQQKFKELADKMNLSDHPIQPLWAKGSHDIGLLTTGPPLFKIIEFNFPIKPGADLIPVPVKQHWLLESLVPAAAEMLQKLCDIDIIQRGYSVFDAATFFIPKTRKELTLEEHIQQGGSRESFMPGTENMLAPQTIRMVSHFEALNSFCYNNPVIQMATSQQLRRISTSVRYISVVDICAAFHSLMLSKEAAQLTGFSPNCRGFEGKMTYKRVPMGATPSKNLLDNALYYVLAGIDNVLIYSDNLLILSSTEEENFERVKQVWSALRRHGLKCKASKCTLMVNKKIKLYGMVIDLRNGRLLPDHDKIAALKNKPIPQTKKQLKQFLGAIVFFSQLMPVAAQDLAVLNRATREKISKWMRNQ